MLIETNPVDWDKPIVYFDGKQAFPAKLISQRWGTYNKTYILVSRTEYDMGVGVKADGTSCAVSALRVVYNYVDQEEINVFDPEAKIESAEAGIM